VTEKRAKWKDLLVSKYDRDLNSNRIQSKFQSWWWRDLSKVCNEGGGAGWFREALGWKVGAGDKARF